MVWKADWNPSKYPQGKYGRQGLVVRTSVWSAVADLTGGWAALVMAVASFLEKRNSGQRGPKAMPEKTG